MTTSLKFRDGILSGSEHYDCTLSVQNCDRFLTIIGKNDTGEHVLYFTPQEAAKVCRELTDTLIKRGAAS